MGKSFFRKRGFLLATALVILPILLIVLFGLISMTMRGSALSARMIRQDQAFFMAESGLKIGYQLFSYNNFWGYTHDLNGDPISVGAERHLLVDPELGWTLASDGWYEWSPMVPGESFTQSSLGEVLRIRIEPLPSLRERRELYVPKGYKADGSLDYTRESHEIERERWRITCQASLGGEQVTHVQEGEILLPGEKVVFDNGSNPMFSRSVSQKVIGDIHVNGDLYLVPWATRGYSITLSDMLKKYKASPLWALRNMSELDDLEDHVEEMGGAVTRRGLFGLKADVSFPIVHSSDRPELEIITNNISSGGKIIRRHDYWGRPDGPADSTSTTMTKVMINGQEMKGLDGRYGAYNFPLPDTKAVSSVAFDSYHPDWNDPDRGARVKFDNKVRDNDLGQKRVQTPTRKSMMPGGYFDKKARLRIEDDSASWAQEKSFYHQSELREETVIEVDLQQLQASSDWPSNNIVYSDKPVRFVNGYKLDKPFTFVSAQTVYIKGNFNSTDAGGGSDLSQLPAATIMTTDKVYRLTNSFDDQAATTFKEPLLSRSELAGYHENFPMERTMGSLTLKKMSLDDGNRSPDDLLAMKDNFRKTHNSKNSTLVDPPPEDYYLDINAVIAEGAPESDNHLWEHVAKNGDLPEGPLPSHSGSVGGELRFDSKLKVLSHGSMEFLPDAPSDFGVSGPSNLLPYQNPSPGEGIPMAIFPTSEPYLENLVMMTIRETGSQVFLRNSVLDKTSDNRDANKPGVTAQKHRSVYIPPAPTKMRRSPLYGSTDHADYTLATNPAVAGIDLTTGEIATGAVPIRGALKKRWYSL